MCRYKWLLLGGLFTLVIYVGLTGTTKNDIPEMGPRLDSGKVVKKKVKEYLDFEYQYDRRGKGVKDPGHAEDEDKVRNVKHSVHKALEKNKVKEALLFPPDNEVEELPKHDFQSQPKGAVKMKPTRRHQNSVNGVEFQNSPGIL